MPTEALLAARAAWRQFLQITPRFPRVGQYFSQSIFKATRTCHTRTTPTSEAAEGHAEPASASTAARDDDDAAAEVMDDIIAKGLGLSISASSDAVVEAEARTLNAPVPPRLRRHPSATIPSVTAAIASNAPPPGRLRRSDVAP